MSRVHAIQQHAAAADHWRGLLEFSRWETAIGGPDPHMAVAGRLAEGVDRRERIWRGLVYLGFYNVPTAEVFWTEWPLARALAEPQDLLPWIEKNWAGLAYRRERRPVRTRLKLNAYFQAAAPWADEAVELPWMNMPGEYEDAWLDVQEIPYLGRYIALKTIEYLCRYCGARVELQDMRPRGGWSPRTALALLFPDDAERLMGDDRAGHLTLANERFRSVSEWVKGQGLPLSNYNLQVLLCDYKQCYVGRRQFPGRSQDSEIAYMMKIGPYWPDFPFRMKAARRELFPAEALSEIQGWGGGVREDLGDFFRDTGRMWSDLLYDYSMTQLMGTLVEREYAA